MKVLVTGGLGFIGSHTVCELLEKDYQVIIIDNLYNSKLDVLDRIKKITSKEVKFYQGDVQDLTFLEKIFKEESPKAIIHFAGYKAVGESVSKPLEYYDNNLSSTLALLKMMKKYHCLNFVFSSSATIYGVPDHVPLSETDLRKEATSPYGETKVMIERILEDVCKAIEQLDNENIEEDIEHIKSGNYISKIDKYINCFYDKTETILDYVSKDAVIFLDEVGKIKARNKNILLDNKSLMTTTMIWIRTMKII